MSRYTANRSSIDNSVNNNLAKVVVGLLVGGLVLGGLLSLLLPKVDRSAISAVNGLATPSAQTTQAQCGGELSALFLRKP